MGERICKESLLIIRQVGEGIRAYFSLVAAPCPMSLPTPYPPSHVPSYLYPSASCPRKVTLTDSWSLLTGGSVRWLEGRGKVMGNIYLPPALLSHPTFLAIAPNGQPLFYGSSCHQLQQFYSITLLPSTSPISSDPEVVLAPQWLILGAPASLFLLLTCLNLWVPLSLKYLCLTYGFELWWRWNGAETLTDEGFLSPWFGDN